MCNRAWTIWVLGWTLLLYQGCFMPDITGEGTPGADDDTEATPTGSATPAPDSDGDGVSMLEDCDDEDSSVYPGADEVCDQRDNDCDGEVDEDFPTETYYNDQDGDGVGVDSSPVESCMLVDGLSLLTGDCDDDNDETYPGATEVCDFSDNDCDGEVDEGFTVRIYYADIDQDGFGDDSTATESCRAPTDYITQAGDCDDTSSTTYPGAAEVCNEVDDDCDGDVDEDLEDLYFSNSDKDGYGDPEKIVEACSAPNGYVTNSMDCNDSNETIRPASVSSDGVSGSGGNDLNGSSIQRAIDDPNNCKMVLVGPGTYNESLTLDSSDSGMTVLGVDGAEATLIRTNNSTHVMALNGVANVRIEGVTITALEPVAEPGAGVLVEDASSVTFQDVILQGSSSEGSTSAGGGMAIVDSEDILLEDSKILDNTAVTGGGIVCASSSVTVRNCLLEGNEAVAEDGDGDGGGAALIFSGSGTAAALVVEGSTFRDNAAADNGGAVSAQQGTELRLQDSVFKRNRVTNRLGGAASNPTLVERCLFAYNFAEGTNLSDGGALGLRGSGTVRNSFFVGNNAYAGGAILIDAYADEPISMELVNNTFVDNLAEGGDGATVYIFDGDTLSIRNNIIADFTDQKNSAVFSVLEATIVIDHNDAYVVQGKTYAGNGLSESSINGHDGNITAAPLFIVYTADDLSNTDLHLSPASPCVDAGNPIVGFDLDGSRPDMGAYGGPNAGTGWPEEL